MNLLSPLLQLLISMAKKCDSVLVLLRIRRHKQSGIIFGQLVGLRRKIVDLRRCRADVDPLMVERFAIESKAPDFLSVYEKAEPLVSVCVGTFNRGELVTERCVGSLLRQTYKNIEVIVVGDCCTDDTAQRLAVISDPRLKFFNLPERGNYPPSGRDRWLVAGTAAVNRALELATGDFICHCDDDDEFLPDKVEKLVKFICAEKVHFVSHPFFFQDTNYNWHVNEATDLQCGQVTTSAIFYHRWLKDVPWDVYAWRLGEAGDWNRIRRLKYMGITYKRYDEVLIRHFKERNQQKS